jgi:hypothetical protein
VPYCVYSVDGSEGVFQVDEKLIAHDNINPF